MAQPVLIGLETDSFWVPFKIKQTKDILLGGQDDLQVTSVVTSHGADSSLGREGYRAKVSWIQVCFKFNDPGY